MLCSYDDYRGMSKTISFEKCIELHRKIQEEIGTDEDALDLFVVMLGTNDLKYVDARASADGMERLIRLVLSANERYNLSSPVFPSAATSMPVRLISPILLKEHVGVQKEDVSESERLSSFYKGIAEKNGLHFLDAALYAEPSDIDGIHLGKEGHKKLGNVIARKLKEMF